MSQDIHLAFAHPSERARATQGDTPLDRISLRDHIVSVEIGAFQAERGTTQRICFNVVVEVRHEADVLDDDVDRILSYDRVTEAIDLELSAERLNLLETLAERIADRILAEPQAQRVFVRIEKLDRGSGALGVEIVRAMGDAVQSAPEEAAIPHPRVVFLTNDAITAPHLTGWIDDLTAKDAPLILCVSASDERAPVTGHKQTQRRIDLLEIEQNAWVLASKDNRCVVVETRTELDWAMKNGQTCVWAPSKIVLDSVDSPLDLARDSAALTAWFAQQMQACEMLVIGAGAPDAADIPVRSQPVTKRDL